MPSRLPLHATRSLMMCAFTVPFSRSGGLQSSGPQPARQLPAGRFGGCTSSGLTAFLAYDNGVMLSYPCCQDVHELGRLRGFLDQAGPCLMCCPFGLDPLTCGPLLWKCRHSPSLKPAFSGAGCAILVKSLDKDVRLVASVQVKNFDTAGKKHVRNDAPLRHQL